MPGLLPRSSFASCLLTRLPGIVVSDAVPALASIPPEPLAARESLFLGLSCCTFHFQLASWFVFSNCAAGTYKNGGSCTQCPQVMLQALTRPLAFVGSCHDSEFRARIAPPARLLPPPARLARMVAPRALPRSRLAPTVPEGANPFPLLLALRRSPIVVCARSNVPQQSLRIDNGTHGINMHGTVHGR